VFDIYIRVSRLGERTEDQATEAYEAACRAWAATHGVDVGEVVEDTDVSGSVAVADRGLERLIRKVEEGESEGILTPYLDRLGRDLIESALAYRRIAQAGGRLVCTADGVDSARPGDQLIFNVRAAFAEDYLSRVKESFHTGKRRAAKRGVYLTGTVPFGYERSEDGTLAVVERDAALIRELFRRRRDGASISQLQRFLHERDARITSRTGVRSILANRVYVGEMEVPTERKGRTETWRNVVPPILTEDEWEDGQRESRYTPNDGTIAAQTRLAGLVYCGGCGKRLRVSGYGGAGARRALYVCTRPECPARASVAAERLDEYVEHRLMQALADREPHLAAVIEGDDRYERAREAVDAAKTELEAFRDNPKLISVLGMEGFESGLRVRKDALDAARRAASEVPPPETAQAFGTAATPAEFLRNRDRAANARFIDRVTLCAVPVGRGRWTPVEDRVSEIRWAGQGGTARPRR